MDGRSKVERSEKLTLRSFVQTRALRRFLERCRGRYCPSNLFSPASPNYSQRPQHLNLSCKIPGSSHASLINSFVDDDSRPCTRQVLGRSASEYHTRIPIRTSHLDSGAIYIFLLTVTH